VGKLSSSFHAQQNLEAKIVNQLLHEIECMKKAYIVQDLLKDIKVLSQESQCKFFGFSDVFIFVQQVVAAGLIPTYNH
jgi:hypothetical protein